jgi:hypothetical protein
LQRSQRNQQREIKKSADYADYTDSVRTRKRLSRERRGHNKTTLVV